MPALPETQESIKEEIRRQVGNYSSVFLFVFALAFIHSVVNSPKLVTYSLIPLQLSCQWRPLGRAWLFPFFFHVWKVVTVLWCSWLCHLWSALLCRSVLLSWEEGQESALGRVVSLVLLFSWLWIRAECVLTLVHGHVGVWKPELPACCYKARKIFLFNLPWYNIIKTISLAIFLGVPSELFTQRLAGRDKRLIQRRETLGGAKNLNSS